MHRAADIALTPALASPRTETAPILIAITIFSVLSLAGAISSTGFLEADSCSHYLYARSAFAEPTYFVNVWGRPFCTGLYAIPAYLGGRLGVRVASLLIALSISLIAREIAKGQQWRWPVLALIFTLAQPLVFLHSFSELTELPFALLISLAFWAYQRRQFFWMSAAIAMTPLARPEGFGFIILAGLALLLHRRSWWIVILAIPVILWDYTGWRLYGRPGPWWHWLADNWPYAQQSIYTPGSLFHFVMLLPVVTSSLIFPATVGGIWLCLRRLRGFFTDHRRRCEILIAVLPLLILVVHSVLYWRGKMASNGELRYLLVVAPFWSLLANRGWSWFFTRLNWRFPLRAAGAAALVPFVLNCIYCVVPLGSQQDWVEAQEIANWYRTGDHMQRYPFLATAHPGIFYYLDLSPDDRTRLREWRKDLIDAVPPHTLLIWDPIYGVFNSDERRSISAEELLKAGWKPLPMVWSGDQTAGKWKVFESPDADIKNPNFRQ